MNWAFTLGHEEIRLIKKLIIWAKYIRVCLIIYLF